MSDLDKILLTASSTICGGLIIAMGSQFIIRFILEPILDNRKLLGDIAHSLIYYANVDGAVSTHEQCQEASTEYRRQAAQLRVDRRRIPFYNLWSCFKFVPSQKAIQVASTELIGLSNTICAPDTGHYRSDDLDDPRNIITKELGLSDWSK